MSGKLAALSVALAAGRPCGVRAGITAAVPLRTTRTFTLPGMPDLRMTATHPGRFERSGVSRRDRDRSCEELPAEGLGTIKDPFWQAHAGRLHATDVLSGPGFRAAARSSRSKTSPPINDHTLNVVKKIAGPPAKFPSNPTLPNDRVGRKASERLSQRYHQPWGGSVSVTLGKPGIYLFGCAFHYHEGMQDVFVVHAGATPGPQATKPA